MTDTDRAAQHWLEVRRVLATSRPALTAAVVGEYAGVATVADTRLLTDERWLPETPLPLADVALRFEPDTPFTGIRGTEAVSAPVRPIRPDGSRYETYAAAMRELAAPTVFEDRPTYRLLATATSGSGPVLTFGRGRYFDGIDVGEACAHEFAAGVAGLPLRAAVGDPCDPRRRPTNVAISTLTIRLDRHTDRATCLLHWRDPRKVGHAGGMYQVLPVGIFQASGDEPCHERADFDLWRCVLRELAEEVLGEPEIGGGDTPVDYDAWPLARRLTDTDGVRAHYLGMGVDPLTFATDLLTVLVVDAPLFDELFGGAVGVNAEGRVLTAVAFDEATVDRFVHREPTQAAGAAALSLAWRHRASLLRR